MTGVKKNFLKLTLDKNHFITESTGEDDFPEYKKKEDAIVRYLLHRHLYGKENVVAELQQNISVDELRIIAIEDAVEDKKFAEAEKLCQEKLVAQQARYYRKNDPQDWNNILYEIYKVSDDTEKQATQAKHILLLGNEKFWDEMKKIYYKLGTWDENRNSLLDELRDSKKTICYRSVLVEEKEYKRLLADLMNNPYDLFYYGNFLVKDYPDQIYNLCYNEISDHCANARDRREYKKVTKQIEQLIKWNGTDTAQKLIDDLRKLYPRRSALLDELDKIERKL